MQLSLQFSKAVHTSEILRRVNVQVFQKVHFISFYIHIYQSLKNFTLKLKLLHDNGMYLQGVHNIRE